MARFLGVLLVLSCVFFPIQSRSDGAPKSACSSMTPAHRGIQAQRGDIPYEISVNRNGDRIRVKIYSPVGEDIEGFMVQARSAKDKTRIVEGRFTTKGGVSKTVDCFSGRDNTLTHVTPSQKSEIVTDFTPSINHAQEIIFRATVAKTFALFYTGIDSSPMRIGSGAGQSENKQELSTKNMYHNCFVSLGCFGLPAGCIPRQDCEVLLTFRSNADGIYFRMSGFLNPSTYMAVGLSMDRNMGDDSVIECFRRGSDVVARESFNEGKLNRRNREMPRDRYDSAFNNGLATCGWTTNYLTESNGMRFDLANNTYYLLLATGPVEERSEALNYHSRKIASSERVNFTAFTEIDEEGVSDSIKVHGCFMVTAWVGLVSVAIILARHFKPAWSNKTLCGVQIWFALHRALVLTALVLVIIAFIVIFVHKDGWNYETTNPHAILGCITTALGLFQPIMALFRPSADHPKRPIFNVLHFLVGNSAHLLAVITLYFAPSLDSSGLTDDFYWVLSIFVVMHLICHFLFQMHTWSTSRKNSDKAVELRDIAQRSPNGQNTAQGKNAEDFNVFKILLLGVYIIFIVVILIAMYSLIGIA